MSGPFLTPQEQDRLRDYYWQREVPASDSMTLSLMVMGLVSWHKIFGVRRRWITEAGVDYLRQEG